MEEKEKLYGQLKTALLAIRKLKAEVAQLKAGNSEEVAVIGMACRFPGGAINPAAFWELLAREEDAIVPIPESRWQEAVYFDPNPEIPGKMYVREGGMLDDVTGFDHKFFGFSALEAQTMDPQQRLLLECVWEAVESAGIAMPELHNSATGVFIGITANDYGKSQFTQQLDAINPYTATGQSNSAAIGRISYQFGFQGPSLAIDTACSSSLVALHLAVQSLKSGESDLTLAGGINLFATPYSHIALSKVRALSPDARCKTFDDSADGYVRGEGCGILLLKRYADAIRDKDPILAVIKGTAVNQDGASNGLTAPNAAAQEKVIRTALKNADLRPEMIDFVEAHGTGTPLGDPIELNVLQQVYNPAGKRSGKLKIGAVKSNIGHLEPAAGVAGALKVIMALQKEIIPGNLHFQTPNQHLPWAKMQLEVVARAQKWPRTEVPRRAGLSSFGYAGTNSHAIFEEAPKAPETQNFGASQATLLPLSARSEAALQKIAGQYADFLETTDWPLPFVAHTAGNGRAHFEHRIAIVCENRAQTIAALRAFQQQQASPDVFSGKYLSRQAPKIALMVPGQGSQYKGMCRQLYQEIDSFKARIDQFDAQFKALNGGSLLDLLYGDAAEETLNETANTQPLLFAISYALSELVISWGIQPAAISGHSIGEFVAAALCGLFSPEQGFEMVARRGELMQDLPSGGGMMSVFADVSTLKSYFNGHEKSLSIAAINAPQQTVVAGDLDALHELETKLKAEKIRTVLLKVSHAFHSHLMEPMLEDFRKTIAQQAFSPMQIPLYSNLTGGKVGQNEPANVDFWLRHVREPVRFLDSVQQMLADGLEIFLEVGSGNTLTTLGKHISSNSGTFINGLNRKVEDQKMLRKMVAQLYVNGATINWTEFLQAQEFPKISLPTYPFEHVAHWIPFAAEQALSTTATAGNLPLHSLAWEERSLPDFQTVRFEFPQTLYVCGGQETLYQQIEGAAKQLQIATQWVPDLTDLQWVTQLPDSGAEILFLGQHTSPSHTPADRLTAMENGLQAYTSLAQTLLGKGKKAPIHLWTHLAKSAAAANCEPFESPMWGLHQSVNLEHPELAGKIIDLDFETLAESAHVGLNWLFARDTERALALRGSQAYVQVLVAQAAPQTAPFKADPDGAYLITGGLGSLGLASAKWLLAQGARHLYLNGRRPEPSPEQGQSILQLAADGAEIHYLAGDISDPGTVPALLQQIASQGHVLKGIIHAAGVNQPMPFAQLKPEDWQRITAAKIQGAWNLHQHTHAISLDLFLLYGSVSSVFGSAQLAHYAAANAFLDGLSDFRHRLKLPATTYNWAGWENSNMIQEAGISQYLEESGMQLLSETTGFQVLNATVATTSPSQWIVIEADWKRQLALLEFNRPHALFDRIRPHPESITSSEANLLQALRETAPEARGQFLKTQITGFLTEILGVHELSEADLETGFFDLGLDSLRSIELKQRLERSLGMSLRSTLLFDYPTLPDLLRYLQDELNEKYQLATEAAPTDTDADALRALLKAKLSI